MSEDKYELNEEAAKGYVHVAGAPPVFENLRYGKIDIRTVSPATIDLLIKDECPHFAAKDGSAKVKVPAAPAA